MTQVVNVFMCHHPLQPALSLRLFSNPLILVGILVGLGLLLFIVIRPVGHRVVRHGTDWR